MPTAQPGNDARLRRERRIAAAIVVLLVLVRSAVFVLWEQSYFDSDQAIIGLMAKHLIERRAFPVFYYGQNYMLGVEAYLAAPVFLIAGISVTTLKLPLLALNLMVALLLLRTLQREVGLRPLLAVLPVLFFAVPSVAVTAEILAPNGGNLAPFAYTVLIWLTRHRPGWCGFFFGLGFLQREFTIYALAALLLVEVIDGTLRSREGLVRRLRMFRTAAEVWLVVQVMKSYSSAAGPGTTIADLFRPRDNVFELTDRLCGDVTRLAAGGSNVVLEHWPVLFGTRPMPLADLAIQSAGSQGFAGAWILVAAALLLPLAVVLATLVRERTWRGDYNFCAFLVLVGLFSLGGYIAGRCGHLSYLTLRYELLTVLGAVGLSAWFLRVAEWPRLRAAGIALSLAAILVAAVPHARLLTEYLVRTPENPKRLIARHLEARGVSLIIGDYWRVYAIAFLTQERIIGASEDFVRIRDYNRIVDARRSEAVRLAREYCPGGKPLMPKVWICPP